MKTELYDRWIKSYQTETADVDIADEVMNRIMGKAQKSNILKRTWENILLDLVQAKAFVRACVLVSGALLGLLRTFIQIYSVLFT